jgi:hypothetical protein
LSSEQSDRSARTWLAVILVLAAAIRLHNIDFGLPSLWDDDEPFFLMFGLKLLQNQTLNPGWFGHPGTITIYLIALCTSLVYGAGVMLGAWANSAQFIAAIYADPSIIMIPQRMMIAIPGVVSVWLTYLIGSRIHSRFVGLVAAAILALSPLHIELSQLIRTDVQMTMWVLLSVYLALPLLDSYRANALVGSSVLAGIAAATKWPAMLILLVPVALLLSRPDDWRRRLRRAVLAIVVAITALLAASPYLLIDYRTALNNVLVEGRPRHLSQTSSGIVERLSFYLSDVLPGALGWPVTLLAAVGLLLAITGRWNARLAIPTAVPAFTFLGVICLQSIMWSRWAVPLLPFLSLAAAVVIDEIRSRVMKFGRPVADVFLASSALAILAPLAWAASKGAAERSHDTRDLAIEWIHANVPAGSSVAVETPAIALLRGPWSLRFPLGELGCIDPRRAMAGQIDYDDVRRATKDRININLSTVPPASIDSCRADFIMVNELDRYFAEARHYPAEVANYRLLLAGMEQVAVYAPVKGRNGGPVVRIFARPRPAR